MLHICLLLQLSELISKVSLFPTVIAFHTSLLLLALALASKLFGTFLRCNLLDIILLFVFASLGYKGSKAIRLLVLRLKLHMPRNIRKILGILIMGQELLHMSP